MEVRNEIEGAPTSATGVRGGGFGFAGGLLWRHRFLWGEKLSKFGEGEGALKE